MPEVNFNLLNPGAELYSGPQVTLDPVKAYETAQAKQQSNMLAQLYAKHYDPQTGGVNYNSLIGEAAQSGLGKYIPDIMGDAQKQSQSMAEIAQKKALADQEKAAAAKYQDEIRREKIKEMATESYGRFRGVKDEESLKAWHLANPELEGTNKAERTAKLEKDLKERGYEAVRAEIEGSLQAITGIKPEKSETQVVELGGRKKLVNTQTGDVIKDLGSAATAASQDDRNTVSFRETADDGTVTMFNKFGEMIGTTKGKKSPTVIKAETAREQLNKDLDSTISELTDIIKPGGLIEQSTSSGIGAAVDVGARVIGKSTQGSRAIASLRPIYDRVLKMVPRFEGPQSDKDTQSYREAAGQLADPTIPSGDKLVAAKTILRLMKERRNQFTTKEATDAGVDTSGAASTPPAGGAVNIPATAIAHLKANPTLKAEFDKKYGAGAADRVLK